MPPPNASDLDAARIEPSVLSWTNAFRSDPSKVSATLLRLALKEKKKKGTLSLTVGGWNLIQAEGLVPLKDLVGDIKSGKIVRGKPFARDVRLDNSAQIHLKRLLKNDKLGHDRPGSSMQKDYQSVGLNFGGNCWAMGENLASGFSDAASIVCGLVIDDEVASRGHRYNIFSQNFNAIGIAFGKGSPTYNYVCVMNFGKV